MCIFILMPVVSQNPCPSVSPDEAFPALEVSGTLKPQRRGRVPHSRAKVTVPATHGMSSERKHFCRK